MSGIVAQNINRQSGLIKAAEAGGGAWSFISKITASADATLSFTSGIDSTYKQYRFYYVNIHPSHDAKNWQFNVSIDGGSNYNVAKTSTFMQSQNNETGAGEALGYKNSFDLGNGTGVQTLAEAVSNNADSSVNGFLELYNPSDTTYVKSFISFCTVEGGGGAIPQGNWAYGYINSTSAVDAIQFSFSANNVDTGDIILHGLKA